MKFLQLSLVNIKSFLKDPLKLLSFFLLPVGVLIFTFGLGEGSKDTFANTKIAYNSEDKGELWEELDSATGGSTWFFKQELAKALDLLEEGEVAAVYNIPVDFSQKIMAYEKPTIQAYRREEGNITLPLEHEINHKVRDMVKEQFLLDKGIIDKIEDLAILQVDTVISREEKIVSGDLHLTTLLLIVFIIMSSSAMVAELMEFKSKGVFLRAASTPNKSWVILGSFMVAMMVFQIVANLLIVQVGARIFKYSIVNLPLVFVNFLLASFFAITLSLALTRVFKNPGICTLVSTIFSISGFFLAMFTQNEFLASVPKGIANLGKFTPHYWLFDSLERSVFFPNTLVVLLMALALFSAGCYKLREFADS